MSSPDQLRGWWASRQGLTLRSAPKTVEACIEKTGWLPTSGAPTAYLSIRARVPGASREAIDRIAMDGAHFIEIPGIAGRPFLLVPLADLPFALRFHALGYHAQLASGLKKDGVTEAALTSLCKAVVAALDECPLSTSEIRKVVNHRDAGALLTIALKDLMLRGLVRRFPSNGRVDSTDYQFELRHPDDRPNLAGEGDDAAVIAKGVEHFLRHYGPATVDEICAWSDLTKGAARLALAKIAEPVEITGWADEAFLLSTDARAWRSFEPSSGDRISFLPYRDPFVHVRRTPALLTRAKEAPVIGSRYGKLSASTIAAVTDLTHHAILCGDALIGVWEYDPKAKGVVTRLWPPAAKLRRRVADAAEELTLFIRDELGDAKLSAVDPPDKRAVRLTFCRQR